jgi:hypothetical protein
MKWTVALL